MSRKDYRAIAGAIRATRSELKTGRECPGTTLMILENKLIAIFERDNPRFDRERFAAACDETR